MSLVRPLSANRNEQRTSVSAAVTYNPPIGWIQVLSSGDVVMKDEAGSAVTFAGCVGGEIIGGPFSELTSMTVTKLRLSDAQPLANPTSMTAAGVTIADAGDYFTTDQVEAALQQLGAILSLGGITKLQLVTGTFVSGLCTVTVSGNVVVTANTRAFPVMQAVVTGSTNLGGITHMFASNVAGGAGVGQVLFRLLGADGATDVDAAGAFAAILVN